MSSPVFVERRDREHVRDVHLAHELLGFRDDLLERCDRVNVERGLCVRVDGSRHTAHQEALEVRVLAAEDGVHLDELPLPLERFEIVRERHEVSGRRKLVRRVPPIRVGEGSELPAIDQPLDAILNAFEIRGAGQGPIRNRLRERRGLLRVRAKRRHDVDPVERVQMIEVDHVVLDALGRHDQIAQYSRIGRRLGADRVFYRADGSDRVHRRAHAADALSESPGVTRVAALEDDLDPPEHGR